MKKALFFLLLSFILCFCVLLFQLRQERKLLERTLRQMDTLREELIRTKRENARILGELFLQKNASLPEEEWYRWLEEALDRYENNAVREVRTAFPRCKEYQIRRLCLFFAGLSYPAIRALTKDSVVSLKEAKSRFRKRFLALGTESGNVLASLLDGPSHILH